MMKSMAIRATAVGIVANCLLLALKALAVSLSDSLTIFSEMLNSLSDVVAAVAILLCVRWAWKSPDESHPFGHRRAEPVAGLIVAIFTGILGFEVCRTAVVDLWYAAKPERIGLAPMIALLITVVGKTCMALYFSKRARQFHSPAIHATAVDCRNDVVIATQGLIAVVLAQFNLPILDTIAALLVGAYIFYSAYGIGMENIDYLMGRAPDAELLHEIQLAAESVKGVVNVDKIRAHYVGTFVHVELRAAVDGSLPTVQSHELAEAARQSVESLAMIDRAFVHIEPAPIA